MGTPLSNIGVYIDMILAPEAGLTIIPVLNTPSGAESIESRSDVSLSPSLSTIPIAGALG